MHDLVQPEVRQCAIHHIRKLPDAKHKEALQRRADDIEGQPEDQQNDPEEDGDGGILAGEHAVDGDRTAMLAALAAFDDRRRHHALDKGIAHVGKGGVAVESGLRLKLHQAMLNQFPLVFVKTEAVGNVVVALDQL